MILIYHNFIMNYLIYLYLQLNLSYSNKITNTYKLCIIQNKTIRLFIYSLFILLFIIDTFFILKIKL